MIRTIACFVLLTFAVVTPIGTAAAQSYAAEVHLLNGSVLRGTVVAQDIVQVALQLEGSSASPLMLLTEDIASIVRLDVPQVAAPDATVELVEIVADPVTPARNGRLMGFGFNTSLGFGHRYTTNAMLTDPEHFDGHFDLELPGFEFRVFPTDSFSLDLLFKFGAAAQHSTWVMANDFGSWAGSNVALMNLYFHFYSPARRAGDGLVAFSFAPGVTLGAGTYYTVVPIGGQIGFSMRVGAEFSSADRVFGFGVHFRPGVFVGVFNEAAVFSDDVMPGVEGMIEFTWTWYVPRPAGA